MKANCCLFTLLCVAWSSSGCMDLGQSGAKKPTLPEPMSAAEEPQPSATPASPAAPPAVAATTPAPPAGPSAEELEKLRAGWEHLQKVAKDVDDFAYDRKGRMNEAQIRDYVARCSQEATTVEQQVPALQPACEALRSMVTYASPLNTNMTLNNRLAGFTAATSTFRESMTRLTPPATP